MSYSYEDLLVRSRQIRKLRTLRGHRSHIYDIAFSPNGQLLASAGAWVESTMRLWDVESGEEVNSLVASGNVSCAAFSGDGQWLAFVYEAEKIRLWQIETGLVRDLIGHTDCVRSVLFSPDGAFLASGGNDHTIRLWHLADPDSPAQERPIDDRQAWLPQACLAFPAFRPDCAGPP